MTALDVYLITRLCELRDFTEILIMLTIVPIFLSVVVMIVRIVDGETDTDNFKSALKYLKISVVTALMFGLFITIIPDKKTMVAMYVIPHITTGETAEQMTQLPPNILKFLNEYLSDEKGDLR